MTDTIRMGAFLTALATYLDEDATIRLTRHVLICGGYPKPIQDAAKLFTDGVKPHGPSPEYLAAHV